MIEQRRFVITLTFDPKTGRNINSDPELDPLSLAVALGNVVADLLVIIHKNAQLVEVDEVAKNNRPVDRPVDLLVPDGGRFRQVGH